MQQQTAKQQLILQSDELQAKKDQTTDETAKADLQAAIDKLNAAKERGRRIERTREGERS